MNDPKPPADTASQRSAPPLGSARLDFIQTLNALEAYPGGKNFVMACRVLAGEIARGQDWATSDYALRVARATFVTTEDRKKISSADGLGRHILDHTKAISASL